MKKALILGICAVATCASASVTITVDATMAPNAFGSPSFDTWAANGIYAMENGLTSYGAPGPAQFNVTTSPLPVSANFVTGFSSWMGQAGSAAPYNNEYGTRASFVAVINGNGGLINMDSFGVTLSSSDAGNGLGVDWPNNSILPGDWTYDAGDIGLIFDNGHDISGGFTVVSSGTPDQMVNEIISIGAGNAYAGYLGDDPTPGATDQDIINYDLGSVPNGYDFTGTFEYGNASSSATFNFEAVPEPSTIIAGLSVLTPFGAGALRMLRKNRKV